MFYLVFLVGRRRPKSRPANRDKIRRVAFRGCTDSDHIDAYLLSDVKGCPPIGCVNLSKPTRPTLFRWLNVVYHLPFAPQTEFHRGDIPEIQYLPHHRTAEENLPTLPICEKSPR